VCVCEAREFDVYKERSAEMVTIDDEVFFFFFFFFFVCVCVSEDLIQLEVIARICET
jgi:hypothetical protein